jgi:hypothetical protein
MKYLSVCSGIEAASVAWAPLGWNAVAFETEEDHGAELIGQPIPDSAETKPRPTYRMWAMHCPFKKTGFPVLGSFGASEKAVVIMTVETWKRLCADVPQLQTTQFEVGSYD